MHLLHLGYGGNEIRFPTSVFHMPRQTQYRLLRPALDQSRFEMKLHRRSASATYLCDAWALYKPFKLTS